MAGALCMGASEVLNLVLKIFNQLVKPYKRRHLTTYQPISIKLQLVDISDAEEKISSEICSSE